MKSVEKVLWGLGFDWDGLAEGWFKSIGTYKAYHEGLLVKLEDEKAIIKWGVFSGLEVEKAESIECPISEIWEYLPDWVYRRS